MRNKLRMNNKLIFYVTLGILVEKYNFNDNADGLACASAKHY